MADIQNLLGYYKNLLIIQYHEKEKAKATIEALVNVILADGIIIDIDQGFNIDTAVGVQLDIIGKYVGVDRFFNVTDPIDYFALAPYDEIAPETHEKYGFSEYSNFDTISGNGTITYKTVITVGNQLNDADYRMLLKLKIARNYSNHSHKSIDAILYEFFGDEIYATSTGDMNMDFYISPFAPLGVVRAAIEKDLLPRPMGVGINIHMLDVVTDMSILVTDDGDPVYI